MFTEVREKIVKIYNYYSVHSVFQHKYNTYSLQWIYVRQTFNFNVSK